MRTVGIVQMVFDHCWITEVELDSVVSAARLLTLLNSEALELTLAGEVHSRGIGRAQPLFDVDVRGDED